MTNPAAAAERTIKVVALGDSLTAGFQLHGRAAFPVQLERALNDNLSALAGAKNFEDTVMSLSAAIHLLTTRLGHSESPHVDLKIAHVRGRAA